MCMCYLSKDYCSNVTNDLKKILVILCIKVIEKLNVVEMLDKSEEEF